MKGKRISSLTRIALIGVGLVGIGLIVFSLSQKDAPPLGSNSDTNIPQPIQGTVKQIEQGKDGVQVTLQSADRTYNVTINRALAEGSGGTDRIQVGAELEVSGQALDGMDPPLIVAERVRVLDSSSQRITATSPLASPTPEAPTPIPATATATATAVKPTQTPVGEPPSGYQEYRDPVAGVSIAIPASWNVTGVIQGQYAIFQSYPEDKYIGGEARDPGDTKCDLNLRPSAASIDELIQQWQADERTSILSDETITLRSGLIGRRFVIDSMGQAVVVVVEIDRRLVNLTCFGDFAPVDAIAVTLNATD